MLSLKKFFCGLFSHRWEGCKCRVCSQTRDFGHVFEGCKCFVCGKIRSTGHQYTETGCRICGGITPPGLDLVEYAKCTHPGHVFVNHSPIFHICSKCGLIEKHEFITEETDTGAWNTDYPGLEVFEMITSCIYCDFRESGYRSNYPDYPYV